MQLRTVPGRQYLLFTASELLYLNREVAGLPKELETKTMKSSSWTYELQDDGLSVYHRHSARRLMAVAVMNRPPAARRAFQFTERRFVFVTN